MATEKELTEEQMKLEQLTRKLEWLEASLDRQEEKRRQRNHDILVFTVGIAYGMLVIYLMTK